MIAATLTKRYGGRAVLDAGTLEVAAGTVHALVGENGAGKSTLVKILAGIVRADGGTLELAGARIDLAHWDRRAARTAGIGIVQQHGASAGTLSVVENAVLGVEGGPLLDLAPVAAAIARLGDEVGLPVDPWARADRLPLGAAQRAEIIAELHQGAKLLILDEPTAVLAPVEVDGLLATLRRLAQSGTTIVLVTHKLDEVRAVADAVTVVRAGKTVGAFAKPLETGAIARAMVGAELPPPARIAAPTSDAPVVLALEGVGVARALRSARPGGRIARLREAFGGGRTPEREVARDAAGDGPTAERELARETTAGERAPSPLAREAPDGGRTPDRAAARLRPPLEGITLAVRAGEIVGVAGVDGNGQRELAQAIAGLVSHRGHVRIGELDVSRASAGQRLAAGLAHIPEDRHHGGLVLEASIADNLALGRADITGAFRIDRARVRAFAEAQIGALDIRPAEPDAPVRSLSGGNQQKIVIARELSRPRVRVVVAAQPTRGVDLGAVARIHDRLRAAAAGGAGVLVISADLDELLVLCHRVVVMLRGRIVGERDSAALQADDVRTGLGGLMTGAA